MVVEGHFHTQAHTQHPVSHTYVESQLYAQTRMSERLTSVTFRRKGETVLYDFEVNVTDNLTDSDRFE